MKVHLIFVSICVLVALNVCYSNAAATSMKPTMAPTTMKPTMAPTTMKPTEGSTMKPTTGPTGKPTEKPTTGKETTKHVMTGSTGKHNGTTVKPPASTTPKHHNGSYTVTISLGTMLLLLCALFTFNY